MRAVLDFLLRHGYWVLFVNVLAEQMGLPLPTLPVFLAMGALAGLGHFSFAAALGLAVGATLLADITWYNLGRTRGMKILRLLCRISLEPDSCVSNTKRTFGRLGAYALLVAKFVPGLSAVAPPMAGLTKMRPLKFITADAAGATLWCTSYLLLGFLFRNQLEDVLDAMGRMGSRLLLLIGILLGAYIAIKYVQRQLFFRKLRVARITPEKLMRMLEAGEDVAVVDMRHSIEIENDAVKLPGAIWMNIEALEAHADELPQDKDVILYCS
jgi:membrane protein DedA with SNARE-associated domain